MRKIARYLYVAGAWFNLVTILFVIFAAGLMLFVSATHRETHMNAGWGSDLPILFLILTGLLGWIPRNVVAWLVAVIVVHTIQIMLPGLRADLPILAAFHPLNAMVLAVVSWMHARVATRTLLDATELSDSSQAAGEPA